MFFFRLTPPPHPSEWIGRLSLLHREKKGLERGKERKTSGCGGEGGLET
jgi:hypothetical protein